MDRKQSAEPSFRYSLIRLDACPVDASALFLTITGETSQRHLALEQWTEVVRHLESIGAQTLLVQYGVRDPDFLHEYEAFYARQHRPVSRLCRRVHAFSNPSRSSAYEEKEVLSFLDDTPADAYLGFCTLRPLRHAPVGATIIKPSERERPTVVDDFPVHIAGVSFSVRGTPYLQQDSTVAACAQASIWMALRTLRRRSGNTAFSPVQLTFAGTKVDRVIPGRKGLSVGQMLDAIRSAGHDPMVIPLTEGQEERSEPCEVIEAVHPYIDSGIPVLLVLNHPDTKGHSVVAIGLQTAGGQTIGLLVHNDNDGPYRSLVEAPGDPNDYRLSYTTSLVVPLPSGVVMSAAEAILQAKSAVAEDDKWIEGFWRLPDAHRDRRPPPHVSIKFRAYLCARHAFRKWARTCNDLDDVIRAAYRSKEMPPHVWVVEIHCCDSSEGKATRIGEVVLDAAADVRHGESVLFTRVTKHIFSEPGGFEFDSFLLVHDGGTPTPNFRIGKRGLKTSSLVEPWQMEALQ